MVEASSVSGSRGWAVIRTALKLVAGAGVTVVALDSLRGKLPSLDDVAQAAGEVRLPWLMAAAAAVLVSVNLFARFQERLLKARGVAVPHCRMVALTYSRSAITFTLPGGSVLSTAYAYREYRRHGADQRTAATVCCLPGWCRRWRWRHSPRVDVTARSVRRQLPDAGLLGARVRATGGLDEHAVTRLVAAGAPIDAFGVGTKRGVCRRAGAGPAH